MIKRVISGISGNALYQAVNLIVQALGVPLFLKFWGVEYYGEWLILFTIPGYMAFSEMGLGTAGTVEMSMMVEKGMIAEVNTLLKNTFWFILSIGSIPFLLLLASVFILPWYKWLQFHQLTEMEFSMSFIILLLYVYVSLFMSLPLNYYRVEKKYHRERVISSVFKLLEFGSIILIITNGGNAIFAAVTYLSWRLFMLGFVMIDLKRISTMFRLFPFSMKLKEVRGILKPGLSLMSFFLGQNLLNQGMITVIGISLGSTAVVGFSTVRTMINMIKQFIGTVNQAIYSEFSYAMGKGKTYFLYQLFKGGFYLNILIASISCSIIFIWGLDLLNFWTGHKLIVDGSFLNLMIVYVLLGALANYTLTFVGAVNKFKYLSLVFVILTVLVLVLTTLFGRFGGLDLVASLLIGFEFILLILGIKVCFEILNRSVSDLFTVKDFSWKAIIATK